MIESRFNTDLIFDVKALQAWGKLNAWIQVWCWPDHLSSKSAKHRWLLREWIYVGTDLTYRLQKIATERVNTEQLNLGHGLILTVLIPTPEQKSMKVNIEWNLCWCWPDYLSSKVYGGEYWMTKFKFSADFVVLSLKSGTWKWILSDWI